jgi:serine/threonine-protein kinase
VTALEQLSHPNIVRISGHGEVDTGAPYLVMEFIEGRSLRELLDQGALLPRRIAAILRQAAGALAALHERSIFHRDLKPENLMIRADDENAEQLVLIDFSIAIVKSPDETFHGISRVAGTMGYMAPEQVIGYADASTDIHALAKIVIEMLTGSRWTAIIPEGTLDMTGFVLTYFGSHPHGLTGGAIAMLAAALAFDPSRRPASASAFSIPIIRDLDGAC